MARKDLVQYRRDTAANWTSVNPTLASGEPGFETDTGKFKIGDGATAWASLAYQGGSGGGTTTNALVIKSDSGTTEGTDLYTFNGSAAKTVNFVSGTGVTIAETAGTLTFNNSGVTSVNGSTGAITNVAFTNTAVTFTAGPHTIQTGADANKGIVIQANSATQSGLLLDILDSTGATSYMNVNGTGFVTFNAGIKPTQFIYGNGNTAYFDLRSSTAPLLITSSSGSQNLLTIRSTASQVKDLLSYQALGVATNVGGVSSVGQVYTGSTTPVTTAVGGATTAATGTGTTATITLTSAPNVAVGDKITVAGITPTGYNGTYIVTAVSNTSPFSVSYANTTTGAQTVAGTVSVDAQVSISARSGGTPGLVVRSGASAANTVIQQWQSSTGTTYGQVYGEGSSSGTGRLRWDYGLWLDNLYGGGNAIAIRLPGSNNVSFGAGTASLGGGVGVIGITNATTAPSTNPTGGGVLYVDTGSLKYLGTSGSATTIANADGTSAFLTANNPTLTQISTSVEGGQINFAPSNEVGSTTWYLDSFWNGTVTTFRVVNGTTQIANFKPDGSLTMVSGSIVPVAGTTTKAPIDFQNGTNLTTPLQGAMEFDGNQLYITGDTTNGSQRQIVAAKQYYRLATGATTIAAGTSFFPAGRPALLASHMYHFRYYLVFSKNTAGTVTFQLKNSGAVNFTEAHANATVSSAGAGLATIGAGTYGTAAATITFGATASIANNAFSVVIVEGFVVPSANTRLDIAPSAYGAGTITTIAGSNLEITDLGTYTTSQGNFA